MLTRLRYSMTFPYVLALIISQMPLQLIGNMLRKGDQERKESKPPILIDQEKSYVESN